MHSILWCLPTWKRRKEFVKAYVVCIVFTFTTVHSSCVKDWIKIGSAMPAKVTHYEPSLESRAERSWSVIENHIPESEVFTIKYGSFLLAIPALTTGLITQRFFNNRFKISKRSYFMYGPTLIPAIATGLLHRKVVEDHILLEGSKCPVCTEFTCAAVHVFSSVLWTNMLASTSSCMVGSLRKTVYVPPIDKQPLEVLKVLGKHFKKFAPTGIALFLGNFAFAALLTHFEFKQFYELKMRMLTRLNLQKEVYESEFVEEFS